MNAEYSGGDVVRSLNEVAQKQGSFYARLGLLMLTGLAVVFTLAVMGFPALGLFTNQAAFVAIGGAILVLGTAQFAFLLAMRRTMSAVAQHEGMILEQSERHAELAERMATEIQEAQAARDRQQDETIKGIEAKLLARPAPRVRHAPEAKVEPFGDVHKVEDVEGIGPHFGKALEEIGITNTRQLWAADATYVGGHLMIAPKTVENWQAMAELMAVKGIGPQYAELLLRAGIRTIERLTHETPEHLSRTVERLEGRREHRVQGNTVGDKTAAHWIEAAIAHHPGGHAVVNA
jgi:predicted flap endonuclease-1-like 5' DNA nuclease